MAGEIFNPEHLRKRWSAQDQSVPRAATPVHPKFQAVVAAVDGLSDARALLRGVRDQVARDLPEHQQVLVPFLDEAEEALGALASGEASEHAHHAQRALEVLWRVEDLLEAYYFLIR